jgi:formate C-acetyltransferase
VEVGAFGKEAYILTGYFNIPKILEITLHNGIDPRTGRQTGLQTGDPRQFSSFDELFAAFERQMLHFIDIKVRGNQVIERLYATYMPAPFLSLLIDDCIANGKDYHSGGARYNTSYIQGVGMGTITDALTALKVHVFEKKTLTMKEMLAALESDFNGHERLRQRLVNKTPKFGNDDEAADQVMRRVFEAYYNAIEGRKNTRGGEYHINLLPTTVHVCILALSLGLYRMAAVGGCPYRRGFHPFRELTAVGRLLCCVLPPRWITPARGERCSTRSSPHTCWQTSPAWKLWCSSSVLTSSSTDTISNSMWWMQPRCARRKSTPSSTAT